MIVLLQQQLDNETEAPVTIAAAVAPVADVQEQVKHQKTEVQLQEHGNQHMADVNKLSLIEDNQIDSDIERNEICVLCNQCLQNNSEDIINLHDDVTSSTGSKFIDLIDDILNKNTDKTFIFKVKI